MAERYTKVMEFKGPDGGLGPRSLVLGGVHGNEKPGINAVDRLRDNPPRIDHGTLYVAYGNPWAITRNWRGVQADLNRVFAADEDLADYQRNSYEWRRAQNVIKPLIWDTEAVLDMHGTRNPQGVPFIIAEKNAEHITSRMPFDIVVSGFDEYQPGGVDYYANRMGKVGICTENGYNNDPASVERALEGVNVFLSVRGHTDETTEVRAQRKLEIIDLHIAKKHVVLDKTYPDFAEVPASTKLGTEGGEPLLTPADGPSVLIFTRAGDYGAGFETHVLAREI